MLLPESRDAGSIPRVLERIGVASMICATQEELCAEIERGAGAVMIEEELLSPRRKEHLSEAPWRSSLPGPSCRSSSFCATARKPGPAGMHCCYRAT